MSTCSQCQATFAVTEEDMEFYDKVSPVFHGKKYDIPPPTLCPNCREQRRTAWRNERTLTKLQCSKCSSESVSIYSSTTVTVYCQECWWSDGWDGLDYQMDPNIQEAFFEQFTKLIKRVPRVALLNPKANNSPFCNFADGNTNSHLLINSNNNDSCYYSTLLVQSTKSVDCLWTLHSELCFECIDVLRCYNIQFSQECINCSDSLGIFDCHGCSHCIGCANLRNKQYYIFNRKTDKQAYNQKLQQILSSYTNLMEFLREYSDFLAKQPRLAVHASQSEDVLGDHLMQCKGIRFSFDGIDSQDCSYCNLFVKTVSCFDCHASDTSELCYESTSIIGNHNLFTAFCRDSHNMYYSLDCHSCSNCFGCIGLKHKEYCILNKQYTKEEYEDLVTKIIEHMQSTREWGEFFPVKISPFAYNETVAQEYFPLSKEETVARGWQWREERDELPTAQKIIQAEKLPQSIADIPDDILNWAIECSATGRPFKIIKQELDFYRTMQLPIPRLHPDERHRRRMALRNPRKLWNRTCAKCTTDIQTTYAPDRPEVVYCEKCYLKEVY